MKNKLILICGVPGTGKTTLASHLSKLFEIDQVISTDFIREVSKSMSTPEQNPFLFSVTHEAWKYFGEKTQKNIILGAVSHAESIFSQIIYLINKSKQEGRDLIIEGVHLMPQILDYIPKENSEIIYIYLYLEDKNEHFSRFDSKNKKRKIFHDAWYSNYETIKIIDNYNLFNSKSRNLFTLENSDLNTSIIKIFNRLNNEILLV